MYQDLVRVVRTEIPSSVDFIVGKVTDVQAGPDRQRVVVDKGATIEARLLVLATGMGDALRHKLGIKRRVVVEKQSLSFGFSIRPGAGESFDFPALTYYGERMADRIDYLSLFPVGDVMRANLFTFRDHRDPWNRDLRRTPAPTLIAALPGLKRFLGNFEVVDPVQNWLMDLCAVDEHRRDGVVLIGDAFQTNCPAAGTGVSRLLVDVLQLCTVHVPRGLATPGMDAAKISAFYDDPVKQAADQRSAELAEYRRSLTTDTGVKWRLHRGGLRLARRSLALVDRLDPRWSARLRGLRSGTTRPGKLFG
jgi:2-polyprenyl-6-methoxyphenol hydroxylase-like FAD-dependent oxidoreductase